MEPFIQFYSLPGAEVIYLCGVAGVVFDCYITGRRIEKPET